MSRVYIGIDPGLNGAIGVIHVGDSIESYNVYDVPTVKIEKSKKTKSMVNLSALDSLIRQICDNYNNDESITLFEAWVEDVHAMPLQGVTSMFSMGRTLGNLEMVLACYDIPIHWVSPQKWKKEVIFGAGSDKLISVAKAKELFPNAELQTKRGRQLDGRAEALLIAEYGRRQNKS